MKFIIMNLSLIMRLLNMISPQNYNLATCTLILYVSIYKQICLKKPYLFRDTDLQQPLWGYAEKNRVHGHAVELQFRAHKMLAIHVHVYICIRFTHYICDLDWLIIFPIESILCKYSILKNTTFEDQAWRVFRCSARFVSFYLYFYIFRKPTTSLTLYHLIIYTAFWSWINSSNFSFFRFFLSW